MRAKGNTLYHRIGNAKEVLIMSRLAAIVFAALLPLAFFVPLSRGYTTAVPSGQPFTIDRVEEGIAALCSEDGRCYFIPEASLGLPIDSGDCILLTASPFQDQASERRTRLELKSGDLLDDM